MALVPFRTNGPSADQSAEDRILQVGGHVLKIKQMPKASGGLISDGYPKTQVLWSAEDDGACDDTTVCEKANLENVGLVVWQLGFVVAELLLRHPPWGPSWPGVRVVDLGTGTGLVGIALALAGACVILTDLEHIVPLTRENVDANCAGGRALHVPRVEVCKWGRRDHVDALGDQKPDLITAADVLYDKSHYGDLLDTLSALSAGHTVSYIAYKRRNAEEESFVGMAEERGFSVEVIPEEMLCEEYRGGVYVVLRLCRLESDMAVD